MDKYVSRDDVHRFIADAFSENRFATNYDYAILVDKIDEIPAADVQPVRHAEWSCKDDEGRRVECHCTNCKGKPHEETGYCGCQEITEYIFSHYCPHCGARMDLKDGDTNG